MTPTEEDLERAKEFAKQLVEMDGLTTKAMLGSFMGAEINGDGKQLIASLIAQVRAETLNDIVKLLQSVLLVSSHKDGIDINKIQTTTQIISIIEAMIPQAQEGKEHE